MRVRHWPIVALVMSLSAPANAAPATYQDFLTKAWALKPGETRAEIVAALGPPAQENAISLSYSLTGLPGFPGMPGPIGTQVFPAATINLHDGRMAGAITWDWMDTIGNAPMSYETFVAHARALRPGMTKARIVAALGVPSELGATFLRYSLANLRGMPPPAGTTFYYEAVVPMRDGRMSGAIKWAWMDTTGPAPATPKPR